MNVFELFEKTPAGYQDEKSDNSTFKKSESRQGTRLTFAHLNRLRQSHDVRKVEHEHKLKAVSKQYAPAPEAGALPGL
jgi:hypothetical protein